MPNIHLEYTNNLNTNNHIYDNNHIDCMMNLINHTLINLSLFEKNEDIKTRAMCLKDSDYLIGMNNINLIKHSFIYLKVSIMPRDDAIKQLIINTLNTALTTYIYTNKTILNDTVLQLCIELIEINPLNYKKTILL